MIKKKTYDFFGAARLETNPESARLVGFTLLDLMPFDGSNDSLFGFLIVFSLSFFCAGFDDGLSAEHFDCNLS